MGLGPSMLTILYFVVAMVSSMAFASVRLSDVSTTTSPVLTANST